jgi:uncharacterized protein YlaN (UPF0358 family)
MVDPGLASSISQRVRGSLLEISLWYSSPMMKRKRRFRSLATELVRKAREAMLTAVQIFNNPQVEFKSELFIVSTIIAWTYLLHAHYRTKGIEYRRFTAGLKRRRFLRTKHGAIYRWSLEECLDCPQCPLEEIVRKNLRFLIGIRHEIEHQMTTRIDDQLSAKFQAAALNFNTYVKNLFGDKHGLDKEQAFSIQFSGVDEGTAKELLTQSDLPRHTFAHSSYNLKQGLHRMNLMTRNSPTVLRSCERPQTGRGQGSGLYR